MLPSARVRGEQVSAGSQEDGSIFTDSLGTMVHTVGAGPGGRLGVWFGDLCHHAAFFVLLGIKMERARLALGLFLHDQEVPEPPKVLSPEDN